MSLVTLRRRWIAAKNIPIAKLITRGEVTLEE
jgi:hypothetical protein